MRISWLIAIVIAAPLLGAAESELRDGRGGAAPCVAGVMTTADGSSFARDLDPACIDAAAAAGQDPQSGLQPGLLAQRSVTYSPAWAGFGVAKAGEAVAFAEVDSEESVETDPREANPRRERWKRIGIGVLHVIDFLAELYLEIH